MDSHKYDQSKFGPLKDFKLTLVAADPRQIVLRNCETMMMEECDAANMMDLRSALEYSNSMTVTEIEEYTAHNSDLIKAMILSDKEEESQFEYCDSGGTAEVPYVLLMIDSGTFRHMIGSNALQYMTNVRSVRAYPVKTAGGIVWLTTIADLEVSGHVFRDCMVNPKINTSLLSQGMMAMSEGWEFIHSMRVGGLQITDPKGQVDLAHTRGVLSYLPSTLLGSEYSGSRTPYSYMTDSETAAQWFLQQAETCSAESEEQYAQNSDNEKQTNEEAAAQWYAYEAATCAAEDPKHEDLKAAEMREHILKVHSTTLKHGRCEACFKGKSRAFRYYLGGSDKQRMETLNADTIVMKVKSCNGNTDAYHGVMTRTRYGVLCANPDKSSASTAKSYLEPSTRSSRSQIRGESKGTKSSGTIPIMGLSLKGLTRWR
jgi:hypothetical protein